MYALMLTPNWPGAAFRRSLFDADGNRVKTLVFQRNEPILVDDDEFAALLPDVGKALCYAKRDKLTGEPIPKVDAYDGEPTPWTPPHLAAQEAGSDEASRGEHAQFEHLPPDEANAELGGKKSGGKKSGGKKSGGKK